MADDPRAQSFDVKDYINAANDSSKRTRTVTIVLVVASVLVLIGWYNSHHNAWMLQRVRVAYDPASPFAGKKLAVGSNHRLTEPYKKDRTQGAPAETPGAKPETPGGQAETPGAKTETPGATPETPLDAFRKQFQDALVRSYVDNTYFIKAPFFGIVLDVNDVGLIGGFALVCVLLLLRFSLSREIKNLNFSFDEAISHQRLHEFYYGLAMHQVFTIPHMRNETRNRLLMYAPRFVCLLPAAFYLYGIVYDYYTILYLDLFDWYANLLMMVIEAVWFFFILRLSYRCWERQSHINSIWDKYWLRVDCVRSRVVLLDWELMTDFGTDEAVNSALKEVAAAKAQRKIEAAAG